MISAEFQDANTNLEAESKQVSTKATQLFRDKAKIEQVRRIFNSDPGMRTNQQCR